MAYDVPTGSDFIAIARNTTLAVIADRVRTLGRSFVKPSVYCTPIAEPTSSNPATSSRTHAIISLRFVRFGPNLIMPAITKEILGKADIIVGKMDLHQRELLADEIHAEQPNLLYAVLSVRSFGATYEQLEVALNILLTCFQSMKLSGQRFRVIDETLQERCLARLTGRMRFLEGLSADQQTSVTQAAMAEHPEIWLMAYAFGELTQHGLMGIKSDAEKYLVLAALNVVECIAESRVPGITVQR